MIVSRSFEATDRSRVVRKAKRASYDAATVHAILDEALTAAVSVVIDGSPRVQPMIHVREGDRLILHGLATNRLLNTIANGGEACINVTLIDAMVLARRTEDHSMHYRSATVHGRGTLVADDAEKERLMRHVFAHLVKGERLNHLPPLPPGYLKGTMVVTVPIEEAVAKVNQGLPTDDGPDGIWSGVVPIQVSRLAPIADDRTTTERALLGMPQ